MEHTEHDWTRLGARLRAARALRGLEQQAVAASLEASRYTLRNIENGHISTISPTTRRYASLLGWPEGAIERVLAGGGPEPSDQVTEQPTPSDLSARIRQAMTNGVLVDGQVLTVPLDGAELTATIVVRGERPPTAAELRQWERQMRVIEDALRNPPSGDDVNPDAQSG